MKTITLSVEQAKSLYSTNKELRSTILHDFTDSELGIEVKLREWKDLNFKDSYYSDNFGKVAKEYDSSSVVSHLNVPTEIHAKSMIAFAKLSMLMADLGNECNVNWSNMEIKYTIERYKDKINRNFRTTFYQFLAFKNESTRDRFLDKHERLIKDLEMID